MSKLEEFLRYIRDGGVAVETGASGVYWYPGFSRDAFLRLNDFPDEPIFTAMCDGEAVDVEDGEGIRLSRQGEGLAGPGVFSAGAGEEPVALRLVESSAIQWQETRSPIVGRARFCGAHVYLCGDRSRDLDRYAVCSGGWARDIGRLSGLWL